VLLIIVALTGVLGFYLGIRNGADTMGALAAQNEVATALSRIDSSIKALNKNDLAYSREQHQGDMNSALFDLGTYAPAVPYWQCKERDRTIVGNVKAYLNAHQEMTGVPPAPLLRDALKFCQR
jgi:hypothetical protein